MPIKSFRGLITSYDSAIPGSGINTISLHTNDGSVGYKIVKFQIMPNNFNESDEYNVKIYKTPQTEATTTFDFSDNTMLAAAFIETVSGAAEGVSPVILFDNEIFNQDIYVTAKSQAAKSINYYIELEQVKLDLNENTVATLKDIRNIQS
tara:strand:+ start:389 stop:838 length:450 start_codon:yes stop_codon:yes gene_type:complete